MEQTVAAAGTVRNLAARAVMAASVDIVTRRSAAELQRAAVDSRGAILAQQRETIRAAFYRACDLAFETTSGGVRLGCYDDGRVRFPLPWSGRSYLRYGLTRTTADILGVLLLNWRAGFWSKATGHAPTPAPVFMTEGNGAWFVNLTYTSTRAIVTATLDWPSLDSVAFLASDLSIKAGAARAKRRAGSVTAR